MHVYFRPRGSFSAIDTGGSSCYIQKSRISKFTSACTVMGAFFMWGAYFCMGAYKHNVVVVIQMGAYIHGVLIIPILRYKKNRPCLTAPKWKENSDLNAGGQIWYSDT